ncbi:MAG: hypothetical protein H6819_03520 [Phycisphaerales bacterium]|nr:hypothetical protein [Phycisphaerales bacterium]MCB9856266.1 hypothetical protein [Phycisphaerales bacterium]MCB9863295.1 hypothetical protein [Phycisphaerales bacterium]
MPTAFLAQFAAGCFLAIAISDIHRCGWRYLRLMAIVSIALAFVGLMIFVSGAGLIVGSLVRPAPIVLACGLLPAFVWLFVNAAQQERVTNAQRVWAGLAGVTCLVAAILLATGPDTLLGGAREGVVAVGGIAMAAPIVNTILGALLLGVLTSAMLLGHRYLTDTNMAIAPLRRLTIIYLVVFGVRALWSIGNSLPVWLTDYRPHESPMFFQIVLIARLGVGLAAAAVFAYMVWDCVKRRATQSATAMFYLSMVLVFIGELAGQFLMRTEGLAV